MGKKRKTVREVLGAVLGIGVFALAVLLLNRGLGWPGSWPTLVATGALGFLASALVSRALGGPWAARAGATCALALLVACSLAGWPFQVVSENQGEGEVWRKVEFFAYLLETEDNGPINNVTVGCRLPTVDNWFPYPRPVWGLYYLDENNNLLLEVSFEYRKVLGWTRREVWEGIHPDRTEPPELIDDGTDPETKVCSVVIDRLYPREVVVLNYFVEIPEKMASLASLRKSGENYSLGCMYSSDNKKVRQLLVLKYWKPAKDRFLLLEGYQREVEYYGQVLIRLYPIPNIENYEQILVKTSL